jgi:hypothetical protein
MEIWQLLFALKFMGYNALNAGRTVSLRPAW